MHPPPSKHDTIASVDAEVAVLVSVFEQKETEDTWIQMDDALAKFVTVVKEAAHLTGFVAAVRKLKKPILLALNTERTRLSRTAMLLCEVLGQCLEDRFEGLSDIILPAVLKLCTRANKVIVTSANNTLKVIIDHAGVPSLITLLSENICAPSPSKSLRISSAECLNRILSVNTYARLEKYVEPLEAAIKNGTVDSTPEVRGLIKSTFELYKDIFPGRLDGFIASLSEVAAKYLKVSKSGAAMSMASKPPIRPRAPTSSSTSSLPFRQPPGRATTITPDNYSSTSRGMDDDDTRSLESETPSFAFELDDNDAPLSKLRVKPMLEISESGKSLRPSALDGAPVPRRMLMERPARDVAPTHLHEHIGGAQRVPKEVKASLTASASVSASSSKPKALRVPAVAPAAEQVPKPVLDDEIDTSRITVRATPVEIPSKESKVKRSSVPKPVPKASSKVEILDLSQIMNRLKSSEWSVRVTALETISNYIASASLATAPTTLISDVRSKAMKYCDALILGLGDNQTKCVMASIKGLLVLVQSSFALPEMIDHILPRVAGMVYYQPQKSKPAIVELGQSLLTTANEYFGVEVCALACIHGINNPEFGKSVKVRAGCVVKLAELSDEDWSTILAKHTNVKLYVARLLSQANDTDPILIKSLKVCIAAIHSLSPDLFWSVWAAAKPAEKKAVNTMFQTSELSQKELETIRKPAASTASSVVGTPVQLHQPTKLTTPSRLSLSDIKKRTTPLALPSHVTAALNVDSNDEIAATPTQIGGSHTKVAKSATQILQADSSEGLLRLTEYDDSDEEYEETELADAKPDLDITSPMDSDEEATPCAASRVQPLQEYVDASEEIEKPEVIEESATKQDVDVMSTPLGSVGSRIPIGGSTSKIMRTGIPLPRSSTPTAKPPKISVPQTTGKMGKLVLGLNSLPLPQKSSTDLIEVDCRIATGESNNPVTVSNTVPTALTKSISFGETTVIDDKQDKKVDYVAYAIDPAVAFDIAAEGTVEDLWAFTKDLRNIDFLEGRLNVVLDLVIREAKNSDVAASSSKGIKILHFLIEHFAIDDRATDVLLAALLFEAKFLTDDVEFQYELHELINTFNQTYDAKTLLNCTLSVLESKVNPQICLEITTHALWEAKRMEGGSDDDLLFGGDEKLQSEYWSRVVPRIAEGLVSDISAVRKAAFDCAVAMSTRNWEVASTQIYNEVCKKSGKLRGLIVRGMLEQTLN